MNSEKESLSTKQLIERIHQNLMPGSEGENIYEEEKEQKFESIPLLKPPINYMHDSSPK